MRGAHLAQELRKGANRSGAGSDSFVGFSVGEPLYADDAIDLLLQGRKLPGDDASLPPVTFPQEVDREVANDNDQPGPGVDPLARAFGVAPHAGEIVGGERFAHGREEVHDIVMVRKQAPDCGEDEFSVALVEQVPRGLGIARVQLRKPRLHECSQRGWPGQNVRLARDAVKQEKRAATGWSQRAKYKANDLLLRRERLPDRVVNRHAMLDGQLLLQRCLPGISTNPAERLHRAHRKERVGVGEVLCRGLDRRTSCRDDQPGSAARPAAGFSVPTVR